jgi:hypothetical protein
MPLLSSKHGPLFVAAIAIWTGALSGLTPTVAAECHAGQPTLTFDSPPDCGCYDGSSPGTRVYGFIRNIVVTLDGKAQLFDGDAVLACDRRRIRIHTYRDNSIHTFPLSATIMKVFEQGAVTAVFPGQRPDAEMKRRIRDQSVKLLKVL